MRNKSCRELATENITIIQTVLSDESVVFDIKVPGFLIHAASQEEANGVKDRLASAIACEADEQVGINWLGE